jgi:hypothetical protein
LTAGGQQSGHETNPKNRSPHGGDDLHARGFSNGGAMSPAPPRWRNVGRRERRQVRDRHTTALSSDRAIHNGRQPGSAAGSRTHGISRCACGG